VAKYNTFGGWSDVPSQRAEFELWNECARLMANCIIYYNANLLDTLFLKLQKEGQADAIEQIKFISPVAWQHVNLYGYYTFEGQPSASINMSMIVEAINMMQLA
jgi:hypothetical protein